MEEQEGESPASKFSFSTTKALQKQRSCYITYTNKETHEILGQDFILQCLMEQFKVKRVIFALLSKY